MHRATAAVCLLGLTGAAIALAFGPPATTAAEDQSPVVIRAAENPRPPAPLWFAAGGRSPGGETLGVNSRYLTRNGKPWFPVMGEFQFSRYPANEWEEQILEMKAGGIQVISTYVFWIHHEEIEGQFDWTGRRNLRRFIELCRKHGMYVWARIGPWDHGECRNGGFPDWLLQKCPTRELNPVYMGYVKRFYSQIGSQLRGLLWRDGGPVIGVQLENEYSARGPGKGADYILALRKVALAAGINPPFFTITGWDNAVIPDTGVLPVFGGYEDGFWKRSTEDLPPNANYFFGSIRCDENVREDLKSLRPDIDALDSRYPYLTAEMGGGMAVAYHRRPLVSAGDIAAMDVVKLGSGVSMYGYYLFHGGTNPEGKRTTLQESQATGYPNDVPQMTYDFQAPLGEFGQVRQSFRVLKTLHLFLADWGSELAPMAPYFPDRTPASKEDTGTPRVAARLAGSRGFLFINNYQRLHPLPERTNFQVRLETAKGATDIPRAPVNVPSGAYMIWPVNLDLGPGVLRYATVQPLCRLRQANVYVFFAWPGVAPELALEAGKGAQIEAPKAKIVRRNGVSYIGPIEPGPRIAAEVRDEKGAVARILVLSRDEAMDTWKANLAGEDRLILSQAGLYFDGGQMHFEAQDPASLAAEVFPSWRRAPKGLAETGADGIFIGYRIAPLPDAANLAATVQETGDGDDPPPAKFGHGVAMIPAESAFAAAPRWTIRVPRAAIADHALLSIRYQGDVARLYAGGKLVADNFYNGSEWQIGLWRIPAQDLESGLELRVLPLREDAPIYLPRGAWPVFSESGDAARVQAVRIIPQYEATAEAGAK